MRVNVANLKKEPGNHITVPLQVAVEPVVMDGEAVRFSQPFVGEAEIWNAGDRLLVRAEFEGEATLPCCRCLTRFALPLTVSFEEEFVEGDPVDVPEDEDEQVRAITYYLGDEIDLSDPVQENILLALPMQPLCSEECRGLCPTCGKNLNEGPCSCDDTNAVDPRLAALKDLLRKPDSQL